MDSVSHSKMAESDETAPGEAAPVARRYRYIVHVKEHTLLVPLSANATVAALTAEVDRRASRRQLVSSAVVDIQVRTAAGIGFLEPTDILTDVITEQEDLVAVLEGSAPVQRLSMVRRTRDAVSKFSLPRAPPRREEGAPAPPAASWTAPVVTIVAADAAPPEALAPAPEPLAAPPPRRRPAASPQSAPGARRAPPAAERTDPLPVSLASKQHEYLSGLLEEIHRHDPTGVPAYKRRILSGLHARPLRSAPSARPLLRPALSARSLRAQLLEQPGGDGLPLIAPRAQSAGARARAPQPDGRAPLAERERQLHGLRAGVSKLQLDGMQLDEKVQALQRQLQRLQAQMAQARAETRMTNAQLMLADEKRRAAVLGRCAREQLGAARAGPRAQPRPAFPPLSTTPQAEARRAARLRVAREQRRAQGARQPLPPRVQAAQARTAGRGRERRLVFARHPPAGRRAARRDGRPAEGGAAHRARAARLPRRRAPAAEATRPARRRRGRAAGGARGQVGRDGGGRRRAQARAVRAHGALGQAAARPRAAGRADGGVQGLAAGAGAPARGAGQRAAAARGGRRRERGARKVPPDRGALRVAHGRRARGRGAGGRAGRRDPQPGRARRRARARGAAGGGGRGGFAGAARGARGRRRAGETAPGSPHARRAHHAWRRPPPPSPLARPRAPRPPALPLCALRTTALRRR